MKSTTHLRDKVKKQEKIINRKENKIKKLRAAWEAEKAAAVAANDPSSSSDSDAETDAEPIFDGATYWCTACATEVLHGKCTEHSCGLKHQWDEEEMGLESSASTNSQAIHADRSLVPRGSTPLLPFLATVSESTPPEYLPDRVKEYGILRKRGATRLMCETFHLEFSKENGIFAWADPDLYEEFGGWGMMEGDFWKIHLGRRVSLDEDDLDGSEFVEGLLEDALLFPLRHHSSLREYEVWETVEESPGIWVTKLMTTIDQERLSDSDDDLDEADLSDCEFEPPNEDSVVCLRDYTTDDELDDDDDDEGDDAMVEEDPGYAFHALYPDAKWHPHNKRKADGEDDDDNSDDDAEGEEEEGEEEGDREKEGSSTLSGDEEMQSVGSDSELCEDLFSEDEQIIAEYKAQQNGVGFSVCRVFEARTT